jgi:hypothetical protein
MPLIEVVRGEREGGARAGARRLRARRGVVDIDFAFHVDSASNKLRNPHDHGPGPGAAGTIRTKRARVALILAASDNSKKREARPCRANIADRLPRHSVVIDPPSLEMAQID